MKYGDNEIFSIKPELGYSIAEVKVDDKSIGSVDYYEFTNITESHSISATFRISTPDELKNAVRGALYNGQTDIVIAGDLSPDQQKAAGEALREWCRGDERSKGTISLTLSDVIQVSDKAFKGGMGEEVLKSLNLPQATAIGVEAFKGQENLESVTVPKVEMVGGYAFWGCGMKNVELPAATTLEGRAFLQCGNLESVTAPKVTTVKAWALGNCWSLKSLTFGSAMTFWGGGVVDDSTKITLTLAGDQKVLTGGDNGNPDSKWEPDGNGAIVEFGLGKTFCGYEFQEIRKAE